MTASQYKVFISHGASDSWVADQMAKGIRTTGAQTYLDVADTPKGANFKQVIHREIRASRELVALFTPWSAKRSWVWAEIGAAWGQEIPVIAVFYGCNVADLEESGQGKAVLEDINILRLDEFDLYLKELAHRVTEGRDA